MATRLRQSIASGNVNPGAQVVLNHSLNVQDLATIPDYAFLDNGDFDVVAATTTTVTLQNDGPLAASANVLLWVDHTIDRALGGAIQNLVPRPFVIRGGSGGGAGSGPEMVNSVAALRGIQGTANGQAIELTGYYVIGDGGGGMFWWEAGVTTGDNNGTIIVPTVTPTGRWIRFVGPAEAYSARWFGVVADGTNETAKMQAAADVVGSLANGGVLLLPADTYDIRNLALPSKVTLRGDGIGKTILRPVVGGPGVVRDGTTLLAVVGAVAADSVVIEGITVDLATNLISANGIALLPGTNLTGTVCTDCTVRDCEVLGADFHEYMIWTMRGQRILIEGCRIDGNITDFARTFTTTHATDTLNITAHGRATGYGPVTVRNIGGALPTGLTADFPYYWINTGTNTGKLALSEADALAGIAVAFSTDGTGTHYFMTRAQQEGIEVFGGLDVAVRGNQVRRVGRAGINLGAAINSPNTSCTGLVVEGNIVQACRVGISLGPAWDAVFGAQNLTDILIGGNDVRDSYDAGIIVATTTPNTTIKNILVEGNTVLCLNGPFSVGLEFFGLTGETHKNVAYRDNVIAGSASIQLGAIALRFANDLVIEDNMIVDCQRGVYAASTDNLRIGGNIFDGITLETVLADTCTDLSILDNQFIRYGLGALNHCLQLTSLTKAWIRGNRFAPTTSAALHQINAGGDQIVITGNRPPIGSAPFNNAGTNPNIGTAALGVGATSVHVPNTLMSAASRVQVSQTAGAPLAFRVVRDTVPSEGFRITVASAAVGDETFRWEIHL